MGELGWEFYVSADMANHVLDTLLDHSDNCKLDGGEGLQLCGVHALDSCRIEKGFRHFGHDISSEDHVLEAGLGFAVKEKVRSDKYGAKVGAEAVTRKREEGLSCRLIQFKLGDPEPLLYHNEAIYRDGQLAGYLSSGNYGHFLEGAVGLGYVPCSHAGETAKELLQSSYEIDVAGVRVPANASLRPMYDPKASRVRA